MSARPGSDPQDQGSRPDLSVVIAIVSDTTGRTRAHHLARCLDAFAAQIDAPVTELIVPHLDQVEGLEPVKARFPEVRFLPVRGARPSRGGREHHDLLRARGLAACRGRVVTLVEDHAAPDPQFSARVVGAHQGASGVVGGAIENGVDRTLNWAVYFCDFGAFQNPVPQGESSVASDANVSYRRSALMDVESVWLDGFREILVNQALRDSGATMRLDGGIVVYQHREGLTLGTALKERFIWARSYAHTHARVLGPGRRLVRALVAPLLPGVLTVRLARTAWSRRRLFGRFLRATPLVVLLQIAWSAGEGLGYLDAIGR